MDIFSLPDVFLRQMMKSMDIKDRLRMRLTCRAFEKLVAETNAGIYDCQIVQGTDESKFSIRIGVAHFDDFPATDDGFEQCFHLRHRLFSGITLTSFSIAWPENASIEFVSKFSYEFKIASLTMFVSSDYELCGSTRLMMANHPTSKCTVHMYFLPDPEVLLALPPMESLHIKDSVIIAAHSDTRIAQVQLQAATILKWLSSHGLDQIAPVGDRIGKFKVLSSPLLSRNVGRSELKILYEDTSIGHKCTIKVPGTYWDYGDDLCRLNLSNE